MAPMNLALVLLALIPNESLPVRLAPARETAAKALAAAEAGKPEAAGASLDQARQRWEEFVAAAGRDSMARPAGWPEDVSRIDARFVAADSTLGAGGATSARPVLAQLAQLLDWLPDQKPVVLKFTGYACKVCKVMEGVLGRVVDKYAGRAAIKTVNANQEKELVRKYKVMLLPTMVFLDRQGKERFRAAREMTEAEVNAKLDILLGED